MEDMSVQLLPRLKSWARYGRTWIKRQRGREVRSWTDYLLVTDRRLFQNVYGYEPWLNLDHFMVLGCIRSPYQRKSSGYLGWRQQSPLISPRQAIQED